MNFYIPISPNVNQITVSLILGLLGSGLFIASCFSINRNRILILGILASITFITSYFLKHDPTAATMVCTALLRNILFIIEPHMKHPAITRKTIALIILPIIITAWSLTINWATFQPYQLLIVISPIILMTGFTFHSVTWLKIFTIINGFGWLTYELITGAYGVIPGELTGLLTAGIALWRIRKIEELNSEQPKKVSVPT